MRRATLLALAVVLTVALTGEAQAVTLVNPDGTVAQPYQRWADQSKMPTVRERIVVQPSTADCPGFAACSDLAGSYHAAPTIEVDPARTSAGTLDFELGHWFALNLLGDTDRAAFTHLAGFGGMPWWAAGANPPDSGDSVEGVFAGTYSFCAHYPASYVATDRQNAALCAFIAAAARAHPGAADWPAPTKPTAAKHRSHRPHRHHRRHRNRHRA